MSDLLALDWEKHQLCGLDAQLARGTVRVRHCFRLQWPAEIDPAEQRQEAGIWLRGELDRLGIRGRQLLISLPREQAVVRQLDVPNVPDEELPELVRMQAETKSSSSLDRLVLDFLPLPHPADADGRQVLMVTISRDRIDRLRELVEAAGLELTSVGLSPAATAELVARAEVDRGDDPETPCLVLAGHGKRIEISVMRQRHLLFSHSTHVTDEDEVKDGQAVLAETRRCLGALTRLDPDLSVKRAWVLGTDAENAALVRLLADRLSCEVRTLDPLSAPKVQLDAAAPSERHAPYSGPLGMLLGETGRTVQAVDFLNPRKPVVKRDRRKMGLAAAAAAVTVCMAAFFGWVHWRANVLQGTIDARQDRLTRLQNAVDEGQPTVRAAEFIETWGRSQVSWLEEMQTLRELLPDTKRAYFVEFRLGASSNLSSGEANTRIQATGYAKQRQDAEGIYQQLATHGYRVLPQQIARSTKDSAYPWQFELDVELTGKDEG